MRGKLAVRSRKGCGAMFFVRLPLELPPPTSAATADQPADVTLEPHAPHCYCKTKRESPAQAQSPAQAHGSDIEAGVAPSARTRTCSTAVIASTAPSASPAVTSSSEAGEPQRSSSATPSSSAPRNSHSLVTASETKSAASSSAATSDTLPAASQPPAALPSSPPSLRILFAEDNLVRAKIQLSSLINRVVRARSLVNTGESQADHARTQSRRPPR